MIGIQSGSAQERSGRVRGELAETDSHCRSSRSSRTRAPTCGPPSEVRNDKFHRRFIVRIINQENNQRIRLEVGRLNFSSRLRRDAGVG